MTTLIVDEDSYETLLAEAIANLPEGVTEDRMGQTVVVRRFKPWSTDDSGRVHILLHLPTVYDNGFYRQISSYNSFFNGYVVGGKKKLDAKVARGEVANARDYINISKNYNGEFLYHQIDWLHFWIDVRSMRRMKKDPDWKPTFDHVVHGMWDFYKLIGYDYKTRKWSQIPSLQNSNTQ